MKDWEGGTSAVATRNHRHSLAKFAIVCEKKGDGVVNGVATHGQTLETVATSFDRCVKWALRVFTRISLCALLCINKYNGLKRNSFASQSMKSSCGPWGALQLCIP
jgi:hypothetical protein